MLKCPNAKLYTPSSRMCLLSSFEFKATLFSSSVKISCLRLRITFNAKQALFIIFVRNSLFNYRFFNPLHVLFSRPSNILYEYNFAPSPTNSSIISPAISSLNTPSFFLLKPEGIPDG